MSKKRVDEAVTLHRAGHLAKAVSLLSTVAVEFVAKRLRHLISIGEITQRGAADLWKATFLGVGPLDTQVDAVEKKSIASNAAGMAVDNDTSEAILVPPSRRILLARPEEFLSWLGRAEGTRLLIDSFQVTEPWGLVALATLARADGDPRFSVEISGSEKAGRFAHALGLLDVIDGREPHGETEIGRTVKLHRISKFASIEPVAAEISRLIVAGASEGSSNTADYFDREEVRRTVYYVLVELMRNVVQHSDDPLGGIVMAQCMDRGPEYGDAPAIQVAVADAGIGIYATLKEMHSEITSTAMALERALWPYFSGTFASTSRGTSQNAGLGLFFVSEMAKLSGGRLLVSSHGGSLFLQGDPSGAANRIDQLPDEYPGTLVVFELPRRGIADYDELIQTITSRAAERAARPGRQHWIRYDVPPPGAYECVVLVSSENTVLAHDFAVEHLIPRLSRGEPVVLNFTNVDICTQSYIHALLFDALRVAWAMQTPLYVRHAKDAVRDGLRLLESYALGD